MTDFRPSVERMNHAALNPEFVDLIGHSTDVVKKKIYKSERIKYFLV